MRGNYNHCLESNKTKFTSEEIVKLIIAILLFSAFIWLFPYSIYNNILEEKRAINNAKYEIGQMAQLKTTKEKCQIVDVEYRANLKYEIRLAGEGQEEVRRDGFVSKSSRTITVPISTIWVREFELERWEGNNERE